MVNKSAPRCDGPCPTIPGTEKLLMITSDFEILNGSIDQGGEVDKGAPRSIPLTSIPPSAPDNSKIPQTTSGSSSPTVTMEIETSEASLARMKHCADFSYENEVTAGSINDHRRSKPLATPTPAQVKKRGGKRKIVAKRSPRQLPSARKSSQSSFPLLSSDCNPSCFHPTLVAHCNCSLWAVGIRKKNRILLYQLSLLNPPT
jgi:hypothetical protein